MALSGAGTLVALAVVLVSSFQLSTCHDVAVVGGSVSCLDCPPHSNLSGIRVSLKCSDKAKPLAVATTGDAGSFETKFRSNAAASPLCAVELLGGPTRLYAFKKSMVSKLVVGAGDKPNSYTISSPLTVYTACPLPRKHAKCGSPASKGAAMGASKTVDLPLPPEWGLAPTSYYFPFFPIIGIP